MQPAALRHLQTQVFIDLSVKSHANILFDAHVSNCFQASGWESSYLCTAQISFSLDNKNLKIVFSELDLVRARRNCCCFVNPTSYPSQTTGIMISCWQNNGVLTFELQQNFGSINHFSTSQFQLCVEMCQKAFFPENFLSVH